MPITSLKFTNVGPFDDIEFQFDEHVNVFTGPNNSGKSTVLMVLGETLVYSFRFPRKLLRPEQSTVKIAWASEPVASFSGAFPVTPPGRLLEVFQAVGHTTFIPALRVSTDFRAAGPTTSKQQPPGLIAYDGHMADSQPEGARARLPPGQYIDSSLIGEHKELKRRRELLVATDAASIRDEAVIQRVIDLDYKSYRRKNPAIRAIVDEVAAIASQITEGFPISFVGVGEDDQGLYPEFQTPDGMVPLNVLSQGTQSIIQWLWHLLIGYAEYYDYPPDLEDKPGILIIDEIDAHLHPSWQRRIIPALTTHFPNLQIFCSTHSPLMLAGLKEGQVQLLRRDDKGKVTVSRNERDIVGWSADEILRGFLDVPNATDLATVGHIERLQELRHKDELTVQESEELEKLRHQVNQDLVGGPMAAQLDQFTRILEETKADLAAQPPPKPPTNTKASKRRSKASSPASGRRTAK